MDWTQPVFPSFVRATSPARKWARATGVLAISALLASGLGLATNVAGSAAAADPNPGPAGPPLLAPGMIRITQANLLSGQPDGAFAADVASVMSGQPDFITYNEVPYRPDTMLAPLGYALFRTPGQYTGATPVAWRTDKWTAINQGTIEVSNKPGRLPGQKVHWGIRYANWVTLQGVDGHVISVISAHLAPDTEITHGLQEVGIRNIGNLANTLSAYGPVLMAGDMNFHYNGAVQYPRDLLASYGFTPSYDVLGTHFPTGDHRGATIDYVFMKNADQFVVANHFPTELNSDHDSVTVDMSFADAPVEVPVSFSAGTVVNTPTGGRGPRRTVMDLMVKAIDNTPTGAAIHLTTSALGDQKVTQALKAAIERDVHVQVLTRRNHPSTQERALNGLLGDKVWKKDWATTCHSHDECRQIASRGNLPATRLLISQSGITAAVKIDSDQPLVYSATKLPTTAYVSNSKLMYDASFRRFFKLVGRTI